MTTNTSAIQWVPKSLDRPQARFFQQLPRPLLRHHSKSVSEDRPSRSNAESAFKKQRLDHEPGREVSYSTLQEQHAELEGISQCSRPEEHTLAAIDGPLSTQPRSSSPTWPVFPVRSTPVSRKSQQLYDEPAINRNNCRLEEVQVQPFVPETPSIAPRYVSNYKHVKLGKDEITESDQFRRCEGSADFLPWKGTHTEDVLIESTIKQGFSDKIQVSQAESSSAKTTLWSSLKHKSGLQVVSSLYISVLDKRQAHGTTAAACTFKPPPRVALTDSKREVWLRDLSNPNIPLRRLSRTIPYGIRGRALLDQFLAKKIPTARSIWLAKCVGANEIRAFKRRGASGAFAAGGETKWVKDWTANVEQFLEAIISSSSTQEWAVNLIYGVRLTTHLLAEGLLDRDQYFEWLLDTINQSGLDSLSIYLIMIRSHLREFGRSRHLGRQLAESLLKHLNKILHLPTYNQYDSLRSEIVDIIRRFIIASPASFLRPERWHDNESILKPIFGVPGSMLHTNFQNLSQRNVHLQNLAGLKNDVEIAASWSIIKSLDSLSADIDIAEPAENLRNIADNPELLVRVCLEWSASIHRKGLARTYVAARLLQRWSEEGVEVETFILGFLADETVSCGMQKSFLYKVIIELIRSRHFSAGKYFQWIIANGMLRRYDQFEKKIPCAIGLIFEISPYELPAHIFNLRQNLLRWIGVSSKDEERKIAEKKAIIKRQLRTIPQERITFKEFEDSLSQLSQESSSVKSGIGRWVWQELMLSGEAQQAFSDHSSPQAGFNHHSPPYGSHDGAEFRIFLEVLEVVEDFTTLADVLAHYSNSQDPGLLAEVTITIRHYQDIFEAIGIAHELFVRLFRQHVLLHSQPTVISFIKALIDLGENLPNCFNETRTLQIYLQQSDSKLSITACSPISEHMTEALRANDSETVSAYTDEVEQLLSSGSSMDKHLLTHVFQSIWKRFEATLIDPVPSGFAMASLIKRLASFDASTVHELTILSVERMLALPSRPTLVQIGIPLISTRIISLEQLLSQALLNLQDERRPVEHRDLLLLELVDLLTADREKVGWSISSLRYRFFAEQQRFIRNFPPIMVSILQYVLRYAHSVPIDSHVHIAKLLQDSRLLSLLQTLPGSEFPNFGGIDSVLGSIVMMKGAAQTISRIMSFTGDDGECDLTLQGRFLALWSHVGSLTLPYRRLYLQAILSETSRSCEDIACGLISVLSDKASVLSTLKTQQWANLVAALPPEQKKTVCDKAEAELFMLISQNDETYGRSSQKHLECLLSVIEKTGKDPHSATSAMRVLVQIHEKLAQLIPVRPSSETSPKFETRIPTLQELEEPPIRMKFNALLRLIHIHQSALRTPNVSDRTVLQLLLLLFSFNNHPVLDSDKHFVDKTYDFLIVLSDGISPSLLSRSISILLNRRLLVDSRLHYINGAQSIAEASWLHTVTPTTTGTKVTQQPFPIRRWETMPDATPLMTENDTSLSLTFFGARKAVM